MSRGRSDLEARVLDALQNSTRGPLKAKEVARAAGAASGDLRSLKRMLTGLERTGKIVRVKGHRYALASSIDVESGVISLTRAGDGFVRPATGGGDVFVPSGWLATAMQGDRVAVRVERHPRGRSREGRVIRVLERARETLVGTFHRGKRLNHVSPLDARLTTDVLIAAGDEAEAEEGDVVVVRLISYGEGRVGPAGSVERVLGALSDPGVDVEAVAYGFGLSLEFPSAVLDAATEAAAEGMQDQGAGRVDLRDLLCFTIDPADAKDHDDALSFAEVSDGKVEVGIHIADVAHFVRDGGPVDAEAFARGTSVYLVDRTVPMLPHALSSEVCSLHPNEDRLAVSLFVTLDGQGRIHARRYQRTLIRCRYGLSYEDAQSVLDGSSSIGPEIDKALTGLDDHARAIRAIRSERGALDLDLPEAKVVLDEEGLPVDIQARARAESHRLIEDFMILANEVVANDMEAKDLPALYRVHEPPTPERVQDLGELLARFGLSVPKRKSIRPADLQSLLEAVAGRDEEALVSMAVLRSMKKARYDPENLGHFGLASIGYLHFTSPIRRYPDLVVHRAVVDGLIAGGTTAARDPELLSSLAEQCSSREQAAEEAERASVEMKKVEFMERHLGESFSGRISGVTAFGFFVTLEEYFVEGLVHVSSLRDDYYRFEERGYALVGERGGRTYRLGDRLEVQVARVDKEARHIDFLAIRELSGRN